MAVLIDIVLLAMLVLTAVSVVLNRDLFAVVMLFSIYSFLTAAIFVSLDAVDVAFTEAAVGAGISSVLMLGTLALTGRTEKKAKHNSIFPLIAVLITGAALVYGTLDMPPFGHAENPVHQHVAPRYIHDSPKEVGLPNMVTSVLASYRGYDTLGETVVVFTALIGVMALLGIRRRPLLKNLKKNRTENKPFEGLSDHLVLRVIAKLIIPMILLFALYVQFHGDFGPGGGFQAGVIAAAAFILYALVFGVQQSYQVIAPVFLRYTAVLGVLLYAGVGVLCIFAGGTFLDYNVLASNPLDGQHYGILVIEMGVGLTVFSVMLSVFYAFASRSEVV